MEYVYIIDSGILENLNVVIPSSITIYDIGYILIVVRTVYTVHCTYAMQYTYTCYTLHMLHVCLV